MDKSKVPCFLMARPVFLRDSGAPKRRVARDNLLTLSTDLNLGLELRQGSLI